MKTFISFLMLCFLSFDTFGQFIKPEFIFTLIGEDALGNKDTVKVGYHSNSLSIIDPRVDLDPRFDNKDISSIKWSKPFEMRMINTLSHFEVGLGKSSKNIIVPYSYEPANCETSEYIQISNQEYAQLYLKCKYPPYKLTWDTTIFKREPCAANSFIVLNTLPTYISQFINPGAYPNKVELKTEGMLLDSAKLKIDFKYPDNTMDTLDAHYVVGFASAAAKFIVGTKETEVLQAASIYPNPGHEKIYLDVGNENGLHSEVHVKIVSMFGQQILKKGMINGTSLEVDVSDLKAGPYVATLTVAGKRISGRFVKL
ncbi:MAG TPA: T9SS type A sorting domain-containing protein [Saprospiraceae bacterium]|nr:T9SS type A sorting domain-containing protein [Saprospiraceae bacterium]